MSGPSFFRFFPLGSSTARRRRNRRRLVFVARGSRLYLTRCDVNTWLAGAFPWFLLRDGAGISYQRGAETSEAVKGGEGKRGEGRRVRRIDGQTLGEEGRKKKREKESRKNVGRAETEECVHWRCVALCVRRVSQGVHRHPIALGRILF